MRMTPMRWRMMSKRLWRAAKILRRDRPDLPHWWKGVANSAEQCAAEARKMVNNPEPESCE
jgi:hypothetical protein